jgi:hypothetical protein
MNTVDEVKRNFTLVLDLQTFADDGDKDDDKSDNDDNDAGNDNADKPAGKTFTQAELDAKIADRIARERKKYEGFDETKAELARLKAEEDARKKAALSETERLQAERDEAAKKATEAEERATKAQESANKRVIDAEIRSIARSLNANDAGDVLALIDKDAISIDDNGNVVGVDDVVKALKEAKPWMFKQPVGADAAGGSNRGSGSAEKSELAALEKELAEAKALAAKDRRKAGLVTQLAGKLAELRAKR